ncbi:MAG TPA: hypothetical protein VJV03_15105, partial [Pyrinomonadaceae bacterium]|nr:hypothetical protein [Pyrinomonadaceae bacterium]
AGNANAQAEELLSFNYGKVVIQVSIRGIERQQFLADPVSALRSQGIRVPESAEAPWREFTQVLRRLKPDTASAGRKGGVGTEALHYSITLRESGLVLYLGTGEANTAAMRTAQQFLTDPIGTLRSKGVQVLTADEREWKQLADSLKGLQQAYARPKRRN